MVSITADQVSPLLIGVAYCAVIDACQRIFDLRRAGVDVADALVRGAADLVPYRGRCLVHRVQIMLHGFWPDAMDEVRRACDRLSTPPGQPALGMALYEQAELHRLRGETSQAEERTSRRVVGDRTRNPGRAAATDPGPDRCCRSAIRRSVDEAPDPSSRAKLLPAFVEILLAAKDLVAARRAVDELSRMAAHLGAPFLDAVALHEHGAVLIAEGDARTAVSTLRRAWSRCAQA